MTPGTPVPRRLPVSTFFDNKIVNSPFSPFNNNKKDFFPIPVQYHISFRYKTQWLDSYVTYEVMAPGVQHHLAPYTVTTESLTTLPMLRLPSHDCSVIANLHFLIPSPFFAHPATPSPLAASSLISISMSLFLFCLLSTSQFP